MIRLTNAPAVICEGVFVDNKTDVKIADTTKEQKAFGVAYAKGVLKTLGITSKNETKNKSSDMSFLVKVTVNALNIRKGAGTKYDVVGTIRDKGVYTIVEVKGNWGRLKSTNFDGGVGWIHLGYTKKV